VNRLGVTFREPGSLDFRKRTGYTVFFAARLSNMNADGVLHAFYRDAPSFHRRRDGIAALQFYAADTTLPLSSSPRLPHLWPSTLDFIASACNGGRPDPSYLRLHELTSVMPRSALVASR
jgi:hypothetical protein